MKVAFGALGIFFTLLLLLSPLDQASGTVAPQKEVSGYELGGKH
jgi:hypothetical protein